MLIPYNTLSSHHAVYSHCSCTDGPPLHFSEGRSIHPQKVLWCRRDIAYGTDEVGVIEIPRSYEWREGDRISIKATWLADAIYPGPVLVRAKRLDAPGEISLDDGSAANPEEFRFNRGQGIEDAPGWRFWFTLTWIESPGCYAVQVDGLEFSEIIVFEGIRGS